MESTPGKFRWGPPLLWCGLTWPIWVALGVVAGHPVLSPLVVAGWWLIVLATGRVYHRRWPQGDMGLQYAWLWIVCSFFVGGVLIAALL